MRGHYSLSRLAACRLPARWSFHIRGVMSPNRCLQLCALLVLLTGCQVLGRRNTAGVSKCELPTTKSAVVAGNSLSATDPKIEQPKSVIDVASYQEETLPPSSGAAEPLAQSELTLPCLVAEVESRNPSLQA